MLPHNTPVRATETSAHVSLYLPTFQILNLIQQSLIRHSANIIKLDLFLNNMKTGLNSETQENLLQRGD